jgi:hypothetical protein
MATASSPDETNHSAANARATDAKAAEPSSQETSKDFLIAHAGKPDLGEQDLLGFLERRDLPEEVLRVIAARPEVRGSYALKFALARHPRTPRRLSLPLLKSLYLFDLVRVAQTPAVPPEIKLAAEDAVLKKCGTLPRGEKITLARRASGRVAAALLPSEDAELVQAALNNPNLSEAELLKALVREGLPRLVVESIARHGKWSHRYHIRLALIRNPLTPFEEVLKFLPDLKVADLADACLDRRMADPVRRYVLAHCAARPSGESVA